MMPAPVIESPFTTSANSVPEPTRSFGSGSVSSMFWTARMGPPAAMRPTTGTFCICFDSTGMPSWSIWIEMARGRVGSFFR